MELILPAIYGLTGAAACGLAWPGIQWIVDRFESSGANPRPSQRACERVDTRFSADLDATLPDGRTLSVPAVGLNISNGGLLLRVRRELAPGSVIFVHIKTFHMMGFAEVRRCIRRGSSFDIGLKFRTRPVKTEAGTWEIRHVAAERAM